MADIFKAYQFLNKALGLKLTREQMLMAEAQFKTTLATQQGFILNEAEANNVEAFIHFRPRKGMAMLTSGGGRKLTRTK